MGRTVLLACASATLASAFTPTKTGLRSFGLSRASRAGGARGLAKMASDEFVVGVLGDLHIDPRKMEDYETGRAHWLPIVEEAKAKCGDTNVAMVSLGDLGESKNCDHNPANDQELFAGTTLCHEMAADFLGSFGAPYEVVGGNHDLEGIDEFKTDAENLEAYLKAHNKPAAYFSREIAEKTLLVGMGSTIFRDAKYTSHEVTIDDAQLAWFEQLVIDHPAEDGWKLFVFTHAPPNGSGLRVLQENHVVNGCCWLNHSSESCRKFIDIVREHRCIKAWFSGHFHLGQDYQDSIALPTEEANRGSCVFAQTSVMRSGASRDTRQQSRLIRGNKDGFTISTINHAREGEERLDVTVTYSGCMTEVGTYAHLDNEDFEHDAFFKVYSPAKGDGCYIDYEKTDGIVGAQEVCWWTLNCGRVLGMHMGMLVEYDSSTLAPLGLVVASDELAGRKVAVLDSGIKECSIEVRDDEGMEGADCAENEAGEQAVVLYDEEGNVTVVQPNEDGSYWRKIVRNKMIRMKEKRREQAGQAFAREMLGLSKDESKAKTVSSWGPYVSTVGTAKKTGVAGLTTEAVKV